MPIRINRVGDVNSRVEPPNVNIRGIFISEMTTGAGTRTTRTYDTQHEVVSSDGLTVRARDVDAFRGSVTVIIGGITSPADFNPSGDLIADAVTVAAQPNLAIFSKAAAETGAFTGEQPGDTLQNGEAYIYYTLNGKDPRQTKANLYTGSFRVNQNASGTDNYILKARTYINGISSVVRKVEFRIVGNQGNYKDVNRYRG